LKEKFTIFYEEDASQIKRRRHVRDLASTIILLVLELLGLILFVYIFGWIAVIPYMLAQLTFMPYPVIRTPNKYSIADRGIIVDEKHVIPYSRIRKIEIQKRINAVSLKDRFGKEFLRLYSKNPEEVEKIIDKCWKMVKK